MKEDKIKYTGYHFLLVLLVFASIFISMFLFYKTNNLLSVTPMVILILSYELSSKIRGVSQND